MISVRYGELCKLALTTTYATHIVPDSIPSFNCSDAVEIMSVVSAKTHQDRPALKLNLATQRLLIMPDDQLPKFYPRPKAVMVIPIYDDTEISQALMGPTVIAHASDSRSTYGHHGGKHHRRDSYEHEGKPERRYDGVDCHEEGGHGRPSPTGRHSDDSKQSDDSDHAHHQNHHEHQPHSPTSPSSPPYDRPFDAPHHNNSSNSHPPKRPALAYQSTQTPLQAPSPKKPSSSTNVLQDMKARHDAFHEAVRNYFKFLPPNPNFCRSCCSGRKRALCIGINYLGQKSELKGCANDARAMRDFLIQQYHFSPSEILLLTDDDRKNKLPTREEMFKAMAWLVAGAKKDDSLFFHWSADSGHGGQVKDEGGRELDGMDEDIFPVDHAQAGDIIDDDLNEALVQPLPAGCRLTAIFDSCHSGTVLDLPYVVRSRPGLRGEPLPDLTHPQALRTRSPAKYKPYL
ncbi:hypothetical protein D9611_005446 [Ephemerocybe angulata]|uniref:Peptidase C14 caspase domain-containing protein n=1 Tax=Ephemerocybe angulata TaxID=980116 RepID=A0A8H5FDK1_9AGAR|nr:hypothetical protein D9611_005446 [Tulosesus angulatus]